MPSLLPILFLVVILLLPRPRTPRRPARSTAHEIIARVAIRLGQSVLGAAWFGGLERGRFLWLICFGVGGGGRWGDLWCFRCDWGRLGLLRGGGFVFFVVGVVVPADVFVGGFGGACCRSVHGARQVSYWRECVWGLPFNMSFLLCSSVSTTILKK